MARAPRLFPVKEPFEGRLAVVFRPRGGQNLEDDVAGWKDAGIDVIVSMMEEDEAEELSLAQEGSMCGAYGIEFINCPVPDHGIPERVEPVLHVVDRVLAHLLAGRRVAAHCFAGIGRSPLLVASVLVSHGIEVDEAWRRLNEARGLRLPDTDEQRRWVATLADRVRARRSQR